MKVSLLMAQTLDGKIAKDANHFPDWTESADKKFFRARTKESGVMIFGRTTFETLPGVLQEGYQWFYHDLQENGKKEKKIWFLLH